MKLQNHFKIEIYRNYDGLSESVIEAINRSCYVNDKFTTDINYRKMGICKKLMLHIFKRLTEIGIEKVVLQTEVCFYPEKIYKEHSFSIKRI